MTVNNGVCNGSLQWMKPYPFILRRLITQRCSGLRKLPLSVYRGDNIGETVFSVTVTITSLSFYATGHRQRNVFQTHAHENSFEPKNANYLSYWIFTLIFLSIYFSYKQWIWEWVCFLPMLPRGTILKSRKPSKVFRVFFHTVEKSKSFKQKFNLKHHDMLIELEKSNFHAARKSDFFEQ